MVALSSATLFLPSCTKWFTNSRSCISWNCCCCCSQPEEDVTGTLLREPSREDVEEDEWSRFGRNCNEKNHFYIICCPLPTWC